LSLSEHLIADFFNVLLASDILAIIIEDKVPQVPVDSVETDIKQGPVVAVPGPGPVQVDYPHLHEPILFQAQPLFDQIGVAIRTVVGLYHLSDGIGLTIIFQGRAYGKLSIHERSP